MLKVGFLLGRVLLVLVDRDILELDPAGLADFFGIDEQLLGHAIGTSGLFAIRSDLLQSCLRANSNVCFSGVENRFADDFADGRVREDQFLDVVEAHFGFDQDAGGHDDFGGITAEQVAAEQALADRVDQQLDLYRRRLRSLPCSGR